MALPHPIGRQREVLYLPAAGHIAVLGTAGSGKTTLAILRAAYLSDSSTDHAGRTLLVTFNRALVTYLRSIGSRELRNVTVENYHKFARGYLNSRGKMTPSAIIDADQRIELIRQAIANVEAQHGGHAIFSKPTEFIAEEVRWIAQSGISTSAAYHQSPPTLPGDLVATEVLPLLWQVLEEYWRIRSASGKQYDWDDIAAKVCEELSRDTGLRRYKHVIIDEGQDFSPMMIKSLVRAVPADGSVTFFGDVAQQIYGSRLTWRSAGLNLVGEPWLFKENYRNTRQIAELALAITRLPHYQGAADLVVPTTPRAAGPKPSLVLFPNENEEIKFVVEKAIELSAAGSIAIAPDGTSNLVAAASAITPDAYAIQTVVVDGQGNLYAGISKNPGTGYYIFALETNGTWTADFDILTQEYDPTGLHMAIDEKTNLVYSVLAHYFFSVVGPFGTQTFYPTAVLYAYVAYTPLNETLPYSPPSITLQPQSQTAGAGSTVIFRSGAFGAAPMTVQWYFNQTNLIAGATNQNLTLTNVNSNQSGQYTMVASNYLGTATSQAASLSVQPTVAINLVPAISLYGGVGFTYNVQYINRVGPTNAPWITLATVTLTNSPQFYPDYSALGQPARFYRIVQISP